MTIEDVILVPGDGGFYCDDQRAIREGAVRDGLVYVGDPITEGFSRIRMPAECLTVLLRLSDGCTARGDAVSVTYGGVAGRDPRLDASQQCDVASRILGPWLLGRDVERFRPLCDELELLTDSSAGRPLHRALQYGASQALMSAAAHAHRRTVAEQVAHEHGLSPRWQMTKVCCQCGEERFENVDKMIVRGADVLPHGLINHTETLVGNDGSKLTQYVQWVRDRVRQLRPEAKPTLHFDVYGTLGLVFGWREPGRIVAFLSKLQEAAEPFPLQIEGAIDAGSAAAQLDAFIRLREARDRAGLTVRFIADEWCNTLEDVKRYAAAQAADMIQIKTPDLGSLHRSIEAVLACKASGMGSYLGGSCAETEWSAQLCAQVAVATEPDQMLAKPGMGVDEGLMIVRNAMAQTIALARSR